MGKRTQHKTNRWHRIPFALIFVLLIGCSQVNDLRRLRAIQDGTP